MDFKTYVIKHKPESITELLLPREERDYYPSPHDWREEILYFLLPDRFSDGDEHKRLLLNREDLWSARPSANGNGWNWEDWAESGAHYWQGGTIRGIETKLDYIKNLGITSIWVGPVFKQRAYDETYHGYGIQDFLEVDPRFGNKEDLISLVQEAHKRGIRVILDIIFNHSGANWVYEDDEWTPPYAEYPYRYNFGRWLNKKNKFSESIEGHDDGVWPVEFQHPDCYTRAGKGDLGAGDIDWPYAEHKRTDFFSLRDFDTSNVYVLDFLSRCYKYWIALTDCDGFRIDTLKHVGFSEARDFCGSIKEYADKIGKHNFFLVGEVAGGDYNQDRYLDVLGHKLSATLDIGEMKLVLREVAKGKENPLDYFDGFQWDKGMGSHRDVGNRHVSILDDHDHVFGEKLRFSCDIDNLHQIVAGVALQLFTLGIPCIYYGTEQAFSGPEPSERVWLPGWGGKDYADRYLREAMFGPDHPLEKGYDRNKCGDLPGFGPFGTSGQHCFDEAHPVYRKISSLTEARNKYSPLRYGRQYLREFDIGGSDFAHHGAGQIIPWSRILDDEEVLCVVNSNGEEYRGGDILVDSSLNGSHMTVIVNTAHIAEGNSYSGSHPIGSQVQVHTADGIKFVSIRDLPPSEVIVLSNYVR